MDAKKQGMGNNLSLNEVGRPRTNVMTRSTVYVVDDDASIRTSLSRLFRVEGFDVESFSTAEEFLKAVPHQRPACLISDVRMPGLSGLELQDICTQRGIRIPMIFITGYGEIPMSVQAMKKGAVDFLSKPYSSEALFDAVNQALEKDRVLCRQEWISHKVQQCLDRLSDRENQVLHGVISGLLNKQIALELGVSEKTVKFHRAHVMTKMKATSVPHLVRLAESAGTVPSKR